MYPYLRGIVITIYIAAYPYLVSYIFLYIFIHFYYFVKQNDLRISRKEYKMEKGFRFNSKCLILTYKSHIPLDTLRECIDKSKRSYKMDVCHEIGKKKDHVHTHALIYFSGNRPNWTNPRKFDIGEIHPNWKKVVTPLHFKRCFDYIRKENAILEELEGDEFETRTNGCSLTLIEDIQAHSKWSDVINDRNISYEIAGKMKWARCVYDARPQEDYSKDVKINNFQARCLDILEKQDNREILWVCQEKGGVGKSTLSNWLIDKQQAFLCNGGKLSDIAHAYDDQRVVVFDLPRTSEGFVPYKAIECFKDGRIFSPKYESKLKRFKPCKVIVLANFMPDRSRLSDDRWNVWQIPNDDIEPLKRRYDAEVPLVLKREPGVFGSKVVPLYNDKVVPLRYQNPEFKTESDEDEEMEDDEQSEDFEFYRQLLEESTASIARDSPPLLWCN